MRLTDLQIRKLKSPKSGQKTYFDDTLSGFGVRVSQGGTKSFVVLLGKSRKRKTIGRYPEFSLQKARWEARRLIGNSSLDDLTKMPDFAFEIAKERFLADAEARNKPRTVEEYRRLLDRHFRFDKPLADIKRQEIMSTIERLRGAPSEAQHAFVAIRTMMNWCFKHGLIETSPVPRLTFSSEARTRVLTDLELKAVWNRAEAVGYPYGTIILLLILTGQRRGEIGGLRRSWISEDSISFPVGFTKNKREHRLPIGPLTTAIINDIDTDSDLLFPSRYDDDRFFNGWSKCKRHFNKSLQFAPYTLHDLRRTYSSNLARLGVPIHVTERLLNHVSGTISGVAAVYNRHSYWDEMNAAALQYEEWLHSLLADSGGDQSTSN